jgi:Arc/MetJ family transcription regulator
LFITPTTLRSIVAAKSASGFPDQVVHSSGVARTRTSIEIDDDALRSVMDRCGICTKTEAVDLALRHLVGQALSREEVLAMRGAWAIADESPGRDRDIAPS